MGTMHHAFTYPLISEDNFKEALRVHFLAGFVGHDQAETSNINLLELNTSYAYLLTYAEFRNGMLRDEASIAKHFVQSFHSAAVEESFEELDPTFTPEWGDELNTLVDRDGSHIIVHDGKPLFDAPEVYEANIPGIVNITTDEVADIAMKMGYSVANELVRGGNIPMYFDIALGYNHGERMEVQGTSVHNAVVILDDGQLFGNSFARAAETSKGGSFGIGRGLTTPMIYFPDGLLFPNADTGKPFTV